MNTHIIHGSDIDETLVSAIEKRLAQESGILKFKFHSVYDGHLQGGDWIPLQDLFDAGRRFRDAHRIPDKDFVFTLTERSNAQNFYASLDPADTRTGFLHAGDWELFIECERELPIAFTIVNMLVGYHTSPAFDQMADFLHHRPIGCANDLCFNKREVIFKLRTGDVCAKCIAAMQRNGWSDLGIDHAMRIISALSADMRFNRFFKPVMEPSKIHIDMDKAKLILPDYDFMEVPLQQVDLAFYLFYLRYAGKEGLYHLSFEQEWAQEALFQIYKKLRPLIRHDNELKATARAFTNLQVREQARSRIKRKFKSLLGPRLAMPYFIESGDGSTTKTGIPLKKVKVVNFEKWDHLPKRP